MLCEWAAHGEHILNPWGSLWHAVGAGVQQAACTYIDEYLYLELRSDSLLLSIVAVLYGFAVDRVNL